MRRIILFCLLLVSISFKSLADSWQEAQRTGVATLDLHWYVSKPFIYQDEKGKFHGLECEVLEGFQSYVKEKHGIELKLNWIEAKDFSSIIVQTRDAKNPSTLGVSAFSITEERKQFLKFSESYLTDITVLVSSKGTPIIHGYDEIFEMMSQMEAVTIKGTVYENMLADLKRRLNIDFKTHFIPSDQNILDEISSHDNRFGFIDLPIYLMLLKNGGELTRQNFFTVKGTGYGYIMPLQSDWDEPLNEFLTDSLATSLIAELTSKYMGQEVFQFIDNLYEYDQLGTIILTKEKEMQLAMVKNANIRLEEEKNYRKILVLGFVIVVLFLIVIVVLYYNNNKSTKTLMVQKVQIEKQQTDISRKNEQLLNRNVQLLALNEEKNNLVSILAHDLRSPLNHIIGISNLLRVSDSKMTEEDREFVTLMDSSAQRMSDMITKILDVNALEQNQSVVLKEQVDVSNLLQEVSSRYQPTAAMKSISLNVNETGIPRSLQTDHLLLFLVLENLLSNALKFSSHETTVSLNVAYDEKVIVFSVQDEGPGFTEEDKEVMFGRFQKLSAQPTGGETSTGLGLSIVKKYVTDLGGKMWLESTIGQGSIFHVSLPV
ncbi:ATP-binding protein [Reichenbachiella sp. MSK19-1]|uniref:ATP-binding protein n=1 Tax=Reichenbachiella sp. MSK19-1 TaxID=1897631 RepID=UPI000E6B7541|nr:ATP-binding protein [Reichenbachiella sp. MSK19-1]RJE75295.1 hypothetical protein BGP76_19570 [Reichenbachiella sp. MSK19-1]